MRLLLLVAMLVVGGCAPLAPPVVFAATEWRTGTGERITLGELEALKQSCGPTPIIVPFDRERQFPTPERANPAYRPGGEALANAPQTGIAAPGNPIRVATSLGRTLRLQPVDECLEEKGLHRQP